MKKKLTITGVFNDVFTGYVDKEDSLTMIVDPEKDCTCAELEYTRLCGICKMIATSNHIYLTGCNQYGLQPVMDKYGKVPDVRYFDEGRLEITGEGITREEVATKDNGCDFREHP